MLKRLFLLVCFAGMVMGLGACATYNLTKMAGINGQIPTGPVSGRPVVVVVKRATQKYARAFLYKVPSVDLTKIKASSEMILPYLAKVLPHARFELAESPRKKGLNIVLEDTESGAFLGRLRTIIAYKVILPDGEERVFRAKAVHSDLLLAKKPLMITTRKCLTKIAGDIAKWLVEKGIVSPSEVNLASK